MANSNPLQSIMDLYNENVQENDGLGYAGVFKSCAEAVFGQLKEFGCGVCDVKYLDGYFIMGSGTNSVVHFHVSECPGWLFGIWWKLPEKPIKDAGQEFTVKGSLFAQYEKTIDKFKPTASVFCKSTNKKSRGKFKKVRRKGESNFRQEFLEKE